MSLNIYQRRALFYAALRSGAYKQGLRRLKQGDEYCCLGVACDVAIRHGLGRWEIIWMGREAWAGGELHGITIDLPQPVAEYYGFMPEVDEHGYNKWSYGNPRLKYRSTDQRLATVRLGETEMVSAQDLNDTLLLNFEQIADAFERTYPSRPPEEPCSGSTG